MTKKLLDGWTQGEALRYAMDKTENAWTDKRGTGAPPDGDWRNEKQRNGYDRDGKGNGGKGRDRDRDRDRKRSRTRSRNKDRDRRDSNKDRGTPKGSKRDYANTLPNDRKPCIEWNKTGKCSKGKDCPDTHACNKFKLNGKICNRTDHPACKHDHSKER